LSKANEEMNRSNQIHIDAIKKNCEDDNTNIGHGLLNILEYRAAASTLRPLIKIIENQAQLTSEYAILLNQLQQILLTIRCEMLKEQVDITIKEYSKSCSLPELIRASCTYVMMICAREYKLFSEFFDLELMLKKSFLNTLVRRKRRKISKAKNDLKLIIKRRDSDQSMDHDENQNDNDEEYNDDNINEENASEKNKETKRNRKGQGDNDDGEIDDNNNDDDDLSGQKRISSFLVLLVMEVCVNNMHLIQKNQIL